MTAWSSRPPRPRRPRRSRRDARRAAARRRRRHRLRRARRGKTTFVRGACARSASRSPSRARRSRSAIGTAAESTCRISTSTASRACRPRSGAISSRTSTTPSCFVEWPEAARRTLPSCAPVRLRARRRHCGVCRRCRRALAARSASDADPGVRHGDRASPRARSCATARCSASGRRARRACSRTPTRCSRAAGLGPRDLDALAVGTGPGQLHGHRASASRGARRSALALDLPAAGVSTLDALAAGAPGALPVIDARRREVFARRRRRAPSAPAELELEPGALCVGDGAGPLPRAPRGDGRRGPAGRERAPRPAGALPRCARERLRPGRALEPIYVRAPDADAGAGMSIDFRPLTLARPRRDRGRSSALLPDAVVALDVRRRAREAVLASASAHSSADGALVGYLIISRYVDAWHVMNIAVDPATSAGDRDDAARASSSSAPRRRAAAATRSRCASRTRRRSSSTSGSASGARGPARLLHGQPRGRADHVARPGPGLCEGREA